MAHVGARDQVIVYATVKEGGRPEKEKSQGCISHNCECDPEIALDQVLPKKELGTMSKDSVCL